jgi:signal transduction histidine kinase
MAESIASELGKMEPARKVEWVIRPGLKTHGDERLLHIVMENLLRNAWKFTGK